MTTTPELIGWFSAIAFIVIWSKAIAWDFDRVEDGPIERLYYVWAARFGDGDNSTFCFITTFFFVGLFFPIISVGFVAYTVASLLA